MKRLSSRWIGIGVAVLVVGVLMIVVAGSGSRSAPAGSSVGVSGAAESNPAPIQPASGMSAGTMFGLIIKVGIVAALLGGSLWLLRRYAGNTARGAGRTGVVTIADTIALAQGRALYVIDLGASALVVGATTQQFTLLGEVTDGEVLSRLRAGSVRQASPLSDITGRFTAALQGLGAARHAGLSATMRGAPSGFDDELIDDHTAPRASSPAFAGALRAYADQAPDDANHLPVSDETKARPPRRVRTSDSESQPQTGAASAGSSERLRALAEKLRAARDTA